MSLPSAKKRKIFDGRYEVLSIVGRGLDSVVYHAKHLSGGEQEVALKVLINNKPKSSLTERLRKEALTLVSCRHKYVVRLDDFHSVADLCYLSMEYAPFGDLRKYITNNGKPISPQQGAEFLRQSLEGMEFIHATGVLHRDLKPDNILVISDKEIRLADFGLALLPGDELDLEELQNGVGTLSYLPPEMLDGQFYDSRSDLYSLGVCFYEALAGKHPFDGAHLSEQKEVRLDKNIQPLHELNPQIPKNVSAVISTLMRYSADERFQSAMEALRALSNPEFSGDVAVVTVDPLTDEAEALSTEVPPMSETHRISSEPPANQDQTDSSFTDLFDDFFDDTDYATNAAANPIVPSSATSSSADPSTSDTQEMSAHRVQQLIEQDSKNKAAATARSATSIEKTLPPESPPTQPEDPRYNNEREDFQAPSTLGGRKKESVGLLAALFNMPPLLRTLLVGTVAALVTIGIVVLSHVTSSQLAQEASRLPAPANDEEGSGDAAENAAKLLFPNLPAGTYAGSIQGVLPGTTSPLALIVRPEQNTVTVVVGIEGWTPATVSTEVDPDDTAPEIVVRSNSVLLNMTGEVSKNEVVGTFSNAITGETGVWSAKKIS